MTGPLDGEEKGEESAGGDHLRATSDRLDIVEETLTSLTRPGAMNVSACKY